MENKRQVGASSLDHLFGPKDSSSPSSSSSGLFGSIFSQPSMGPGKDSGIAGNPGGSGKSGNPENITRAGKGERTGGINVKDKDSIYQNQTAEPCYFSSSIYYGGQEHYSPKTKNSESHHHTVRYNKDGEDDDPNSNNPNSASRGNWWKGSLYY